MATIQRAAIEEQLGSREFLHDPYPTYRELQRSEPVYWSDAFSMWLVTRYDDVLEMQHFPEKLSNFGWEQAYIDRLPADVLDRLPALRTQYSAPTIVFSDPPEHTRLRKHVNRAFVPRAIQPLRGWLEELSGDLLDRALTPNHVDVIHDLAFPLPLIAISRLFGGEPDDAELYVELSQAKVAFLGTPQPRIDLAERFDALLVRFHGHLEKLLARLAAEPDDTLLSSLLQGTDDDRLTEEEVRRMCLIFLSAGHETTTSLIGNAVLALSTHQEQLEAVQTDRTRIPAVIEEALRWQAPIQRTRRIAREDFSLGDAQLRGGQEVALVLGAANRDPTRFDRPDTFDLERDATQHLALGHGIHYCIGAGLARIEAAAALNALLDRVPALAFDPGWSPSWVPSANLRLLEDLPLVVG